MTGRVVVLAMLLSSCVLCGLGYSRSASTVADGQVMNRNEASTLALAFLNGVKNGDKAAVYQASGLTSELVEASRGKLTAASGKLTAAERKAAESSLRISGTVDFYLKKLTYLLPRSAQLVYQTIRTGGSLAEDLVTHEIRIVYPVRSEAVTDKAGRTVKELVLNLYEHRHRVDGRELREYMINQADFDKFLQREFEVRQYY